MKTREKTFDEFEELVLELDMARIIFAEEEEEEEEARIVVSIKDITDRKRTEEALHRSEENFHRSLDDSPLGTRIVTIEGETVYANRAMLDIYGYNSIEELNTTPVKKRYTPESYAEFQIRKEKRRKGEYDPSEYEVSIVRKNGEVRQLQVFRKEILWNSGRQFQIIYQDITERKRAEEALRESEEKYRLIAENTADLISILDMNLRFTYVSPASMRLRGFTVEEAMKQTLEQVLTPESMRLALTVFEKEMQLDASGTDDPGRTRILELEEYKKDGSIIWMEVSLSFLRDKDRKPVEILIVSRDITERKQAEEQLHASLREKEILLREVHHRVKNNMQVISGLLDLQARSSGNPELIEMLNESQRRIRSMALVHEKLYGSKDFARIDLVGYVRTLSQDLFQSYKINPGKIDLIVQPDSDIYVDINKAIPCGLILNELISNALKFAFPGDGPGELQIIIHETKNTEIEIVVRDNGLSLPDDVDIHQPRTVGLYLVNGLVKNQLNGQMEVKRDNGTEFRIKFPL